MDKNIDKINQKQPFEVAKQIQSCTLAACTDDDDQNRLKCRKCNRLVHYECSQLPLYQLQIFVNTYNEQYLCHNCVRITRSLMNKIGENSYHMMQKEIEKKDDVIKKLRKEVAKNRDLKTDIASILTEKMADFQDNAKKMIKEEIQRTKKVMEETSQRTYAEITKSNKENLKSAVKEQKEEEKIEAVDIQSRNKNLIIHGVVEPVTDTKEKEDEFDKRDIEDILDEIGLQEIKPTHHHRIGQKDKEGLKWRPIKVILQTKSEKEQIMRNLYKLKHAGLSITDDFTINERKKIKEMHQKAKNLNKENNGDFVWRVRGSPRTSLRLVRKPRIETKESLTSIDEWTDVDDE